MEETDVIQEIVNTLEKMNDTIENLIRAFELQAQITDDLTQRIRRLESFDVLLSRN
jgi:hypothetical protein